MGSRRAPRLATAVAAATLGWAALGGGALSASLASTQVTDAVPAPRPPTPDRPTRTILRDVVEPPATTTDGALKDIFTFPAPGAKTGEVNHEDTSVLNRPLGTTKVVLQKVITSRGQLLSLPVQGPVTSMFGMRHHPLLHVFKLHTGTDFGVSCGTPVGASAPGVVVSAGWAGGNGVQVVIDHGVLAGHHVRTTYNHLSAIGVRAGQKVQAGDGIGLVGNTGYSTACHLHFEVIADGQFTDPLPWLNGKPVIIDISGMRTIPMGGSTPSTSPSATPSATPSPSPAPSTVPSSQGPSTLPSTTSLPSVTPQPSSSASASTTQPPATSTSPSTPTATSQPVSSSPVSSSPVSSTTATPTPSAPTQSPSVSPTPTLSPSVSTTPSA